LDFVIERGGAAVPRLTLHLRERWRPIDVPRSPVPTIVLAQSLLRWKRLTGG
jgi:hypothetical protein